MIDTNFERRLTEMPDYSAQDRWQKANLTRYAVKLRNEADAELIAYIDDARKEQSVSEIFREALQMLVDSKSHIGK